MSEILGLSMDLACPTKLSNPTRPEGFWADWIVLGLGKIILHTTYSLKQCGTIVEGNIFC